MGYVLGKRKNLGKYSVATVGKLIDELSKLPEHYELYCCGDPSVYLHVDDKNECCSIDYDNLNESYEEEYPYDENRGLYERSQ